MSVYDCDADIQFLYWNTWLGDPGDFESSFDSVLRKADNPDVIIDGQNTSSVEKESQDDFYDSIVSGDFEVLGESIAVAGERYNGDQELALLMPLTRNYESINNVDSGPVLEEEKLSGFNPFNVVNEEGNEVSDRLESDHGDSMTTAERIGKIRHIDEKMCSYIDDLIKEDRDTVVVRNVLTKLPYQLETDPNHGQYDVHESNLPVRPEGAEFAISMARTPR